MFFVANLFSSPACFLTLVPLSLDAPFSRYILPSAFLPLDTICFCFSLKTYVSWYFLFLTSLSVSLSLSLPPSVSLCIAFSWHLFPSPHPSLNLPLLTCCLKNKLETDDNIQGDALLCNDRIPGATWAWPQLSQNASSLHRRIINAKTHYHSKKKQCLDRSLPLTQPTYILNILFEKTLISIVFCCSWWSSCYCFSCFNIDELLWQSYAGIAVLLR